MRRFLTLLVALVVFGAGSALGQTKQVSGVVTSSGDNQPIPGANVFVKESPTIGTITDINGKYTLKNVPGNAKTIVFRFVGFTTLELPIKAEVNASLQAENQKIEEVVVTALGVSRNKKALGYSAASVNGDDIAAKQVINPVNALQGKIAGVDISSAPGPGATQNVMIRGAASFGNNQPLYIVDGVPLTNSQNRAGDNLNSQVDFGSGINAINPNDIKDMTILKGAAATALYGSRAANGVIMITTKSGQNTDGKIKITYDGSYTLSRVGRLPEEQKQFGQGWSGDRALEENGNWGAPYDGKDRLWGRVVDNSQKIKPYSFLENRIRDFYDFGTNYKNSISLYGGSDKTNYYASFSHNKADGVIPTDSDSYERFTISTRGQHKSKYVTVSTSVNFSTEENKAVASGQGSSVLRSLQEIASDISIVDLKDYHNQFNNLENYFTPYGVNPYFVLNEDGAVQNKNKFFGKGQIDITPFKDFILTYRFGGDFETSIGNTHTAVITHTKASPNYGSSTENAGSYQEMRRQRVQVNHDFFANYKLAIAKDFSLNAIAGLNVNERKYSFLEGSAKSIDIPGKYMLSNSNSTAEATQYMEERRIYGVYTNLDFSYSNYAFLTLTARNDWSSTLPKDSNSFFYPGATFSFLVTDFLKDKGKNTGLVDFAKFRLAYGMTGNDADVYNIYNRYASAFSSNPGYPNIDDLTFPIGGVNAYTISNRLGNDKLKPELTYEFEVGAEMKFFNYRLGFDVSYYNKLTKGLIATIPLDPSTGYTSQISNLVDVRNQGVEITMDATPVKISDFKWDISVNFAKNINKVEKLDVPEVFLAGFGSGGIYAVEGKSLGQFKFPVAQKVMYNGVESTVVDGSGKPVPTVDQQYLGKDVNEKFRLGFTSTFNYKGISLSGTLDYRYGGYIYSNTKEYMFWTGSSTETTLNDRLPFLAPNSVVKNSDGTYSENTTSVNPTGLHDYYTKGGKDYSIIERSYLKLRSVSLAYSLPKSICNKLGVGGVDLSFNANNFLLWTPADNRYIDPETTTFGNNIGAKFGEFGANPSEQYFTLGLSLKF